MAKQTQRHTITHKKKQRNKTTAHCAMMMTRQQAPFFLFAVAAAQCSAFHVHDVRFPLVGTTTSIRKRTRSTTPLFVATLNSTLMVDSLPASGGAFTDSTVIPEIKQRLQHTTTTNAPQELGEAGGDNKETRHIRKDFLCSVSRSLPQWGRFLNRAMNMPIITHADAKHVHAISGATWFLSAYPLTFYALYREIAFNDWSTFASFAGILPMACLASVLMGVTSIPMRPTRKSFRHYSIAMRSGMISFPLCASMSAFLAISAQTAGGIGEMMGGDMAIGATNFVLVAASAVLFLDLVLDKEPLNIESIIRDLKLEDPPRWALYTALAITVAWLVFFAATDAFVLLHGSQSMDSMTTAFVSQMAFSLAMSPSGSALAGTLMQRDRFTKRSGEHVFVTEQPNGKFSNCWFLDAAQLMLGAPGPYFATLGVAWATGHADWVQALFTSLVPNTLPLSI